ncbi:putative baseplate assembly protein [Paenibacillus hemerocallicola]|uniref:Putative baseplate assembly protein n=1 Tax=Paenibacillus hemerocallicola TaxID=1172614 RepID=A0A5C4T075_9BACL|nr:putative baseplate assembly protein [Paenibacillus hemerocallicola]TNJ62384.1 putative baseplate assembly protein [Paenibacillus hemerocallicola]
MNPPQLDTRTRADLIARMKELAPYYTPEWRFTPDDPDPGTALFLLFADMYHENVKRLNRVPAKNLVAFLNMFDVSLLPARPSVSYVTFSLNEGTREPVLIMSGTRINAVGPDGDIPYETDRTVLLTPSRWHSAYLSSKTHDSIVRIPQRLMTDPTIGKAEPTPLFRLKGEPNLQEHALYLAHASMLTVYETAIIEVEIGNSSRRYDETGMCNQLTDSSLTEWSYATPDGGWRPFDTVTARNNRIVLTKSEPGEIAERELNGVASRWIRCQLTPHIPGRKSLADGGLALDRIAIKTDYDDSLNRGGLDPDLMFYNDIQTDPAGFYPFGDQFVQYGTFYMASREALTKRDGWVRLDFTLKAVENRFMPEPDKQIDWKMIMKKSQFEKSKVPIVSITHVAWEYWNGNAWVRLNAGKDAEKLFYHPSVEGARKTIAFRCPNDMDSVYVNGHDNFWIRGRILQIENAYAPLPIYLSPWLENVKVTYGFDERVYGLERCLTLNNTVFEDKTLHSRSGLGGFEPFVPLGVDHPTLHIGFDAPPVRGPISIYASIVPQRLKGEVSPWLEWEYLRTSSGSGSRSEWAALKVIDGTKGLTESGTIQFAGPADFAEDTVFGSRGYWIRAVNRDDRYDDLNGQEAAPRLNGLFLNTVQAIQQESVPTEYPESRELDEGVYSLTRRNVVSEEVWVDETGRVSEEDLTSFEELGDPLFEAVRDSDGQIQRVWVRWSEAPNLADSSAKARHYTIDRTLGKLRFGDGIYGMEPPKDGLEKIRVSYRVTLGRQGNTEAGTIKNLQNSIAFVGGVTNVEPAAGGCDPESMESAVRRGPQLLKHRGRAVTAEDFEWLAREAYPNIAKVKCMANRNAFMEAAPASMTIVVLPKEGRAGLPAFGELRKKVESYLLQRASSLVAWPEQIRVVPPVFLEISIAAVVAVEQFDEVLPTELAALQRLERFLDPLTGNFDGKGWEIGQTIHPSVFYALLKTIRTISFVEKLYMSVYLLEDDRRIEIDGSRPLNIPHGVIVSGKHKVSVHAV